MRIVSGNNPQLDLKIIYLGCDQLTLMRIVILFKFGRQSALQTESGNLAQMCRFAVALPLLATLDLPELLVFLLLVSWMYLIC